MGCNALSVQSAMFLGPVPFYVCQASVWHRRKRPLCSDPVFSTPRLAFSRGGISCRDCSKSQRLDPPVQSGFEHKELHTVQ